jgi:hypothetical protein
MYRIRLCNDSLWQVQKKRAPGLAGGIWRQAPGEDGHPTKKSAERELAGILAVINP